MLFCSVPFMIGKSVSRIYAIQPFKLDVTFDFGDNRGSGNRLDQTIASNNAAAGNREIGDHETVCEYGMR